jgi:hypothetical protein
MGPGCVRMPRSAISAKIAAAVVYARTVELNQSARIVEAVVFASTVD